MAHGKGIKKLLGEAKHPFEVLVDVATMPGKVAAFAPMLPFIGGMEQYLKKQHVNIPGSKIDHLENTVLQFFQVAIMKKAPLTKSVGLASQHLESLDLSEVDLSALNTGNTSGSASGEKQTALAIIKKVISFFTAMKKKSANQPLTADEQTALGNTPVDTELVSNNDKAQDTLVSAGVGNVKSDGTQIPDTPDYGHGLLGFFRKILHHPLHTENAKQLINSLESLQAC